MFHVYVMVRLFLFGEKYIIKKQKDTDVKEETDGGCDLDEKEDEWNRQMRQKREKSKPQH
jgi:hypothetical protein